MKNVTCEKLIDLYQKQLVEFFAFDPDVKIEEYEDEILKSQSMFKNLSAFINQIHGSIDGDDYNRILTLINIYRDNAFAVHDEEVIEKCNEMIGRLNNISIDGYNLYIRNTINNLAHSNINPYDEEYDVTTMKKIFEMNLNVIKMLFEDDENVKNQQILFISRNEFYFYSLNYLFDSLHEITSDKAVLTDFLVVTIVNKKQKNNGVPLFIENPRIARINKHYNKKLRKMIKRTC